MSNTTIQLKKSGQTGNTPSDLNYGEVAINYADGKLFYKNGVGIKAIENQKTFSTINANNSLIIATTPTDILSLVAGSNLLIDTNTITKTVTFSVPGGSSIDTLARDIATNAYNEANTQNVINQTQNTWITNTNTKMEAAYDTANSAYAAANNVAPQIQPAFNAANAGIDLATAAYGAANTAASNTIYLQTVNDNQNTSISAIDTLATAAYGKANAEGEINNTQNTNITNVNTFAQAAYDTANLKFNTSGGTITGNTTIQQNLVVEGDLSVLGNSVTIGTSSLVVEDSLIFLANGNISTDALDIGIVGHYNPGSGLEHTGIFRDPNLKEWIVFQGYTPEIQSNNLINIADPTFAYANLYANVVKSNVISTYITVNGLDVDNTMTNAWNSANAGVTLATAAYAAANTAQATPNVRGIRTNNTYFPVFVDSNNAVAGAESLYSTSAITFNPSTNTVSALSFIGTFSGSIAGSSGSFSTSVSLTGDNDYIEWGANSDTRMMYNGTANTINLQMRYDATSFDIDYFNGVTSANKFAFYGANGDFQIYDGGIVFRDGTKQNTETLTIATAAYAQANSASGNTVALQAQMTTTNTDIISLNTFAHAAFAVANSAAQTSNNATYFGGYTDKQLEYSLRASLTITGGGVVSANTGGYVNWSRRFIIISNGRDSTTANSGFYDITVPAAGTTITGVGGATNKVVGTSGIPLGGWEALYYILPLGSTSASVAANFRVVNYTSTSEIPAHWILICIRNSDTGEIRFANGTKIPVGGTANTDIVSTYSANVAYYANLTDVTSGTYYPLLGLSDTGTIDVSSNSRFQFAPATGTFTASAVVAGSLNLATGISAADTLARAAYGEANAESTINSTQNTWITNTDTLARAAYGAANNASSSTQTRGIQTNASYFPIFVDANNATATAESLYSHGSLTYNPATGTASATVFSATSDENLKENIQTIENSINTIKQLRGVTYTWKNNKEKSMGLIAQEVEKIIPEVVRQVDDHMTIDYSNIIGLLVEGIKEQQKQIDELKSKINGTNN